MNESETIELKRSTSELKEALISIVAILNKHQKGKLYFGVKNNGEIIGQDVSEKTLRQISRAISDHIEPKVYPKIFEVTLEGRRCICLEFSGEDAPYHAFGRAYIRTADEDRRLSLRELENAILRKNQDKIRWDSQPSALNIRELDEKAVKEFVGKANNAGRIDFRFESVEETLTKLGLMNDGRLLRAADVLFSSKNPVKVQAAVFAGEDKLTFLDISQFEGNLFELLAKSESYLKEKMNWRVRFGKLEREEIPEVPIKAVREALVNSLCHRDYSLPEANQIAVYKNRIEIYNPGSFPEGLSPEDFINSRAASVLRNPLIADALFRTKDIEKWGSGLKRIYDECKGDGVKVEFKNLKTGFVVVFYRKKETSGPIDSIKFGKDTGETAGERLGETERKIVDIMLVDKHATIEKISDALGLNKRTVEKHLAKLKKKGVLIRMGPAKGGYWKVFG